MISKGERHKLVRVDIVGNKYFDTRIIRERMFMQPAAFNLRRGRYSRAFQTKDEATIADLYKSNGFRDVRVAASTQDDYKGKKGDVAVTVTITEGSQWLVDNLTIDGMAQIPAAQIRPLLSSIAGEPFAEVNLAATETLF